MSSNVSVAYKSDLGIADLLNLKLTNQQKWIGALVAGLLFLILSSSFAYQLTNKLFTAIGGPKASTVTAGGQPTTLGLISHTIVFILLLRLILW
jgi:hypothetical protein